MAEDPLPALLAIGALALGIGAASAIFTIINAIAIQPLPYRDSDRLVIPWSVNERLGIDIKRQKSQATSVSVLEYRDWLTRSEIFENLVIFASTQLRLTKTDDPISIQVYVKSPGTLREAVLDSGARRPDGKARRPRIPGVFEGGATQPAGMPRPEGGSVSAMTGR